MDTRHPTDSVMMNEVCMSTTKKQKRARRTFRARE